MLDVRELDVEEESVTACARCRHDMLLLDVLLRCAVFSYYSSFFLLLKSCLEVVIGSFVIPVVVVLSCARGNHLKH